MGEGKDDSKPVGAETPSEGGSLTPPSRRSGKVGAEMSKDDELKPVVEKPDQPKTGAAAKDQSKGKTTTKVRSPAQLLRRNPWK